jgi:hypothetical protein
MGKLSRDEVRDMLWLRASIAGRSFVMLRVPPKSFDDAKTQPMPRMRDRARHPA